MINAIFCWWNGWRVDLDGWLVRARRPDDEAILIKHLGDGVTLIEESAVAVQTLHDARLLDRLTSRKFDPWEVRE